MEISTFAYNSDRKGSQGKAALLISAKVEKPNRVESKVVIVHAVTVDSVIEEKTFAPPNRIV